MPSPRSVSRDHLKHCMSRQSFRRLVRQDSSARLFVDLRVIRGRRDRPSNRGNWEAGSLKLAVSLIPPSADYPIALDTFDGHRRPTRTEPDNFTLVKTEEWSGSALPRSLARHRRGWEPPTKR